VAQVIPGYAFFPERRGALSQTQPGIRGVLKVGKNTLKPTALAAGWRLLSAKTLERVGSVCNALVILFGNRSLKHWQN
jgi:hypothetical protein